MTCRGTSWRSTSCGSTAVRWPTSWPYGACTTTASRVAGPWSTGSWRTAPWAPRTAPTTESECYTAEPSSLKRSAKKRARRPTSCAVRVTAPWRSDSRLDCSAGDHLNHRLRADRARHRTGGSGRPSVLGTSWPVSVCRRPLIAQSAGPPDASADVVGECRDQQGADHQRIEQHTERDDER